MDMHFVRSCLRSDRPAIEIPEFHTTYQRTRIAVNLLIAPSAVVFANRFDYGPVVVISLIALAVLILAHSQIRRRSGLVETVTFDTFVYIAMTVLTGFPELSILVVLTQTFLVFFHVPTRTALILTATYISTGLAAAILTIFVETPQRAAVDTGLLVAAVTLLTALPTAWVLSQAAAAMHLHRDKEEALAHEKDELLVDKDRFVASVSHELRTPLTTVVGLAHSLAEEDHSFTEMERAEFMNMIVEQSEEVAAIVDDLLVAARAGTGHLSLVVGELDLDAELAAVVPDDFEIDDVETAPVLVVGDPIRVRQVLRNLTSNCIRYGGPTKRVRVFRDGFTGVVSVEDDGDPISEDQVETIFTAYGRAHDRPGRTDSVGLGLTVSRQLAQMMGGDVLYRHDGTWAAFEFRLPIAMKELTRAMYAAPESARLVHRVAAR